MDSSISGWGLRLAIWVFIFGSMFMVSAVPTGPDFLNLTLNETGAGAGGPGIVNVSGGVISSINVSSTTQNPHWKAFVGWIDGKFTLDDSGGSSIYDWSFSSSGGEVYATRASGAIAWGSIACATPAQITAEEVLLAHSGEDNISSTFSGTNTGTYVVSGTSIGAGSCSATNSYISDVPQGASFEEFILTDSSNIVFATEIEDDIVGYDDGNYDFQMIIPENGSESFTGSTAYYLYLELN